MTILLYKNGQWLIDGEQPLEGVSLDNLAAILTNPADGDVIKYDEASGMWIAGKAIPAVSAVDNGKVLTVENGAWAAGERDFVVTITYANSKYSADKTYAEILAAIQAGYNVIASYADEWYQLTYARDNESVGSICFSCIYQSYNTVPTISISRANIVTKKSEKNFLPLASSSDNGSELIVKNGSWTKQKKKFIVTITPTALDYSGTMDKTVAEITAAYEAGMEIVFRFMSGPSVFYEIKSTVVYEAGINYKYPSFEGYMVEDTLNALVYAKTGHTDDGTKQTYSTTIYSLTPAS